jgi:hypothetical protein
MLLLLLCLGAGGDEVVQQHRHADLSRGMGWRGGATVGAWPQGPQPSRRLCAGAEAGTLADAHTCT